MSVQAMDLSGADGNDQLSDASSFNLNWLGTLAEAKERAFDDVTSNGGSLITGDLSQASRRWQMSSTAPIARLLGFSTLVRVDKKAMRDGQSTDTQRPVDDTHVREIAQYLQERVRQGNPYWFGQLAFNVHEDDDVNVYAVQTGATRGSVVPAYMVVRPSVKLFPVDGNHRLHAFDMLRQASIEMGDDTWDVISKDCIQFCIIDEPDTEAARQLFVDAAKAKPLPPSLLASFSSFDYFPGFAKDVVARTPLFRDRIDRLSRSLGKNPRYLLTMNQLRVVVAEFTFGASDRRTIEGMSRQFEFPSERQKYLNATLEFFEAFARANDGLWHDLLHGKPANLYEARQSRIDFTTSGLQMIARVGHALYFKQSMDAATRDGYITRLGQLPYEREAELWHTSLIKQPGYRIATQSGDIHAAYKVACEKIGLDLA